MVPSLLVLLTTMEQQIVTLGQTVDIVALAYMTHLKEDDAKRLDEWSTLLDDWKDRARDLVCDYTPKVPGPTTPESGGVLVQRSA